VRGSPTWPPALSRERVVGDVADILDAELHVPLPGRTADHAVKGFACVSSIRRLASKIQKRYMQRFSNAVLILNLTNSKMMSEWKLKLTIVAVGVIAGEQINKKRHDSFSFQ
jgi:hypothetical protein